MSQLPQRYLITTLGSWISNDWSELTEELKLRGQLLMKSKSLLNSTALPHQDYVSVFSWPETFQKCWSRVRECTYCPSASFPVLRACHTAKLVFLHHFLCLAYHERGSSNLDRLKHSAIRRYSKWEKGERTWINLFFFAQEKRQTW